MGIEIGIEADGEAKLRTKRFMRNKFKSLFVSFLAFTSISASTIPTQAAITFGPSSTYIIKLTPSTRAAVESAAVKLGGTVDQRYQYVFEGFTLKLPDALLPLLQKIPNILTVEKDVPVSGFDIQNTQSPTPSWGIDRIDQRTLIPSNNSGYVSAYGYRSAGKGSTIYIADTGLYPNEDIAARISTNGYTSITDGNGTLDCNGHGTHVASTAAGTKYGVAKNATLVPVRVLGCTGSGSVAGVIAGLDWILSPLNTNSKSQAVVNMSLGGNISTSLNDAIGRLTNAGINVVVAAGNSNLDACQFSPASAPSAITVGATDVSDVKASYSNWGNCVDLSAPGSLITGAWITNSTSTNTISGTSMATPHVAGAVAVYLGLQPNASVAQVTQFIDSESTKDAIIKLTAGTPNKLLYVSPTDGGAPIVPPAAALRAVQQITHQSASVIFDINAGNAPTQVSFAYSLDAAMANPVSVAISPSSFTSGVAETATAQLTNLLSNSKYYFQVTAKNESGEIKSAIGSFQTALPPVSKAVASTSPVSNLTSWGATLNGLISAGNGVTTVNFVYSADANFVTGVTTSAPKQGTTVSGNSPVALSLDIQFLKPNTTYYFKVVGTNSAGVSESSVGSFKTSTSLGLPPVVSATKLTSSPDAKNAVFTGTVNPKGQTTTVTFRYGTEKTLTTATSVTLPISPITGDTDVAVSVKISDLTPGRGVYYSFQAINDSGKTLGNIEYVIPAREVPKILDLVNSNASTSSIITLFATINAGASNTRINFEYSTSANFDTNVVMVQATPYIITSAVNTNVTANLSGLKVGTTYYYRVAIQALTGPEIGWIRSQIKSFVPVAISPTPTPTPTPTPSPTPTPTPTPTPSPTPTPTPAPGTKLSQTIIFPELTDRNYGGPATTLRATASSGLPVTYKTSTSNVCQVLSLGSNIYSVQYVNPVTAPEKALCIIIASQVGNTSYNAAIDVTRSFNWLKVNTKIVLATPFAGPSTAGTFLNLKVDGVNSVPLTITNLTTDICAVSDVMMPYDAVTSTRATIRSKANGVCRLQIDYVGEQYFISSSTIFSSTISNYSGPAKGANAAQTINFPEIADRVYGPGLVLNATATSQLPISYKSLTPSVCYILYPTAGAAVQSVAGVSGDNQICTIEASQPGDDRYAAAASVTRTFKWGRAAMKLTVVNPPKFSASGPFQLTTYVGFVNTNMNAPTTLGHLLTVTSNTPTICTVQSNQLRDLGAIGIANSTLVAALNNGDCTLNFKFDGTADRQPVALDWTTTVTGFAIASDTKINFNVVSNNKVLPATGGTIPVTWKGENQINLAVVAVNPLGTQPSISNTNFSVSISTPSVCALRSKTPLTYGSGAASAFIVPVSVGSCNVKFDYLGNTAGKLGASTASWSVEITK